MINERRQYEEIKSDILDAIEAIRSTMPDAAKYLIDNLIMDDANMTFCYTGDDRLQIKHLFSC